MTLLLTRSEVTRALPMIDCVAAVESAFAAHAAGLSIPPDVLGAHVDGGGFHVKTAGLRGHHPRFVAKVNANFPGNARTHGLPTIQGALILFDATNGIPLAIMDSAEITRLRTAAATAVAAKWLSRSEARTLAVCGCGVQGRAHVDAIRSVRPIMQLIAFDTDRETMEAFATDMAKVHAIEVRSAATVHEATRRADIVVTCTGATKAFLTADDVAPGTFVGAVGADWDHKSEIAPELMRRSTVVTDILDQCAQIGDLHHAIDAGVMTKGDVAAELADVVSGRRSIDPAGAVVIFDSTGTAIEDVGAASLAYERALASGIGREIDLTQ